MLMRNALARDIWFKILPSGTPTFSAEVKNLKLDLASLKKRILAEKLLKNYQR